MPPEQANPNPSVSPKGPDFTDGVDDSALLDLISGIEHRLSDLKEAQLSAHSSAQPSPAPTGQPRPGDPPPAPMAEPADAADPARRAQWLDQREREIADREQVLIAQTERIDEECKLLEQARAQIASQSESHKERTESIARARAELDAAARDLESRERLVTSNLQKLETGAAQLESEQSRIAESSASLRVREAEIEERAKQLEAQSAELITLRESLADQQRQIESEAEQYAQLQGDMASLFERLTEAEQAAGAQAKSSTDSSPELEEHWRSLESECTRLKRELSTTRKALREAEHDRKKRAETDPVPITRIAPPQPVTRAGWILTAAWLVAGAMLALAAMTGLTSDAPAAGAIWLGPAFSVYLLAAAYIARRLLSPPIIAVSIVGATFGLWAPAWVEGVREAFRLWEIPLGAIPFTTHELAPAAIAMAICALAMTWILYLVTGSAKVLGAQIMATLVIVPFMLAPVAEPMPTVIAGVLWHVATAAALTRWAFEKPASGDDADASTAPRLRPSVG